MKTIGYYEAKELYDLANQYKTPDEIRSLSGTEWLRGDTANKNLANTFCRTVNEYLDEDKKIGAFPYRIRKDQLFGKTLKERLNEFCENHGLHLETKEEYEQRTGHRVVEEKASKTPSPYSSINRSNNEQDELEFTYKKNDDVQLGG